MNRLNYVICSSLKFFHYLNKEKLFWIAWCSIILIGRTFITSPLIFLVREVKWSDSNGDWSAPHYRVRHNILFSHWIWTRSPSQHFNTRIVLLKDCCEALFNSCAQGNGRPNLLITWTLWNLGSSPDSDFPGIIFQVSRKYTVRGVEIVH